MTDSSALSKLTRRGLLGLGLAAAVATPAHAEHPALTYMRKVARDLLNASRQGTIGSFKASIEKYADVAQIGDYSLGQYKAKLQPSQKGVYYSGVVQFMARYLAEQSRQFPIAKYEIGDATQDGKDVVIASKVYLMNGQTYNVGWRLGWRRGSYKVTDVKVLGFSLIFMQRGLFTSYITKKNGDVSQLVLALNR
ncbi:ABC transporter substrate-binding protein [Aestuariivirga sp.]|uniref:ABC transporter substrate-binding protein n=1 Tax=Aestuariivirga sp. TaxID=2650926 RepID=UPI0039E3ABEB